MASFGGYWDQFQPHTGQNEGGATMAEIQALPRPALPGGAQPVAQFPEGQSSGVPLNTGAPASGGGTDYRATFQQLFPGETLSPEQLAANEDKLKAAGFRLLGPNAAGQRSKIELPNGQIVDVIGGAGSGQNRSQWLVESGGGGGGAGGMGNFQVGNFTGGGQYPLSSVMGTGLAAPWTTPFNAPDPNSITNDKSLQWQMGRGMEAIQRSAAAKGTLLTGGTLKQLDAFGQGLGSTYYNDVYGRKLGEYSLAHNIWDQNQQNLYSRLFGVAGMGGQAASALGNYGNAYGTNATNLETGMGSARSAGTVGIGNAISNAVGGVINAVGQRPQGTDASQTSYDPNKPAPPYGDPSMTQGSGVPWNTGPMSENPYDPMYQYRGGGGT